MLQRDAEWFDAIAEAERMKAEAAKVPPATTVRISYAFYGGTTAWGFRCGGCRLTFTGYPTRSHARTAAGKHVHTCEGFNPTWKESR